MSRYPRLSPADLINIAAETANAPMHMGIVATLDGASLCDEDGRLRLSDLRTKIERRLAAVPRLRQVMHSAGPFAGRPIWVDAPALRIEQHVLAIALAEAVSGPDESSDP